MAVPKTQRTGSPHSAKTNGGEGMDLTRDSPKTTVPESLVGSPDSSSSLSSLSSAFSERSHGNKPSSSSSERSVKFADMVETVLVPGMEDMTVQEKEAIFMTEADYRRCTVIVERDVDYMLLQEQRQQAQRELSPKTAPKEDDDVCFLGLDGVTPRGSWIRENLQRSGKEAVTVEQYSQRCQQGYHQHSSECCILDDESVAAAYIPVAMQAQTLAYERAVRNAMEADQFPTTMHQRKRDHPLQYEFILPHLPEL
jgi:hypothetical protein